MKKLLPFICLSIYLATGVLFIFLFDGTADSGDSILHYLFARYAPQHPELFFNHWAKPVFVLMSSPFSQFGFMGMKFFNLMVSGCTLYITYATCKSLEVKNPVVVMLILMFAPYNIIITLSGLTEPLFALFLISGVYLVVKHKLIAAAILISFLPFVRSEGLIMAGMFALFFIVNRNYKAILFLICGHVVYSLAGWFVHGNFGWVINEIPYNRLSSAYGSGEPGHFITSMIYVVGVPVYLLFWLGTVGNIIALIQRKEKSGSVNSILILGGALVFIAAHSLFWTLGIFNSMGLIRVLVGIIPLIAIIALVGFNFISEHKFFGKLAKPIVQALLLLYIVVFPFTDNPAAINVKKDLLPDTGQICSHEVADFIIEHGYKENRFFTAYAYFSLVMNWDYFDKSRHVELKTENIHLIRKGDCIIWDDWFAKNTSGINLENLENMTGVIKIKEFYCEKSDHPKFVLFKKE
jgi:hypothetical protein